MEGGTLAQTRSAQLHKLSSADMHFQQTLQTVEFVTYDRLNLVQQRVKTAAVDLWYRDDLSFDDSELCSPCTQHASKSTKSETSQSPRESRWYRYLEAHN